MQKNIKTNNKAFTIIEVVLVLAIAGLIFLIVFTALPQLQQSRRDTARKSDLGLMVAKTVAYSSDNGSGQAPDDLAGFTANVIPNYITDEINDPSGDEYAIQGAVAQLADPGDYTYVADEDCAGNDFPGRFSIHMKLEDGTACQDDQ